MKKYNIIDLFAGCGGLADGFLQTGKYKTLATVDWEKPTVNTLRKRLEKRWKYVDAEKRVLSFDIQRVDELLNGYCCSEYGESDGLKSIVGNQGVDVVVGGPPCQAYSLAGRIRDHNGMNGDYRNFLFESYVKVVEHFKPKLFVFENVEGILSAKPGGINITERIKKDFNAIGYSIIDNLRNAVVNTSQYGIPQVRKRVVIIGLQNDLFFTPQETLKNYYLETLNAYKESGQTIKDAIADLPALYPTQEYRIGGRKMSHTVSDSLVENHTPRFHNVRDQKIFEELAIDFENGRKKYPDSKSLISLYKEKTGRTTKVHKYHVLKWGLPSNTIPAHLYKDGLRHIHPDPKQARSITIREAARIQTFDDDFIFTGSMGDQYKMIGNAVPPKLARHIGNSVADLLNKEL